MKKCKECLIIKPDFDFYKHKKTSSRRFGKCKECVKFRVRQNRREKIEYYRQYDAARFKSDPKVKERHRRYQKTSAGKASMGASRKKWIEENQDKRAAHVILGNAVKNGKKDKPNECSICGRPHHRIHGHHDDYTKPLDVIWCCPQCHADIHRKQP